MPDMLLWVIPLAGGLLSLVVVGRYSMAAVMRDWEVALSPELRRSIKALEDQVALDAAMVDHAYASATRARHESRVGEAVKLLSVALWVVEQAVPDRLTRLRAMSICCRMAAAFVPLPPLRPDAFRLKQLMTLTGLGRVVHHLLVSGHERFRLRLGLLHVGFRVVLRMLTRSASHARSRPAASAEWTAFSAARDDFKSLDREHVSSFAALVMSLAAQEE